MLKIGLVHMVVSYYIERVEKVFLKYNINEVKDFLLK